MNNAFDRRERTVFVSMIHRSVTDDDLYEMMSQAGPIEKIIFKENADGTLLHALVIFRNIESVVFSIFHLQPMAPGAKLIQVRPLRESSHRNTPWSSSQPYLKPPQSDGIYSHKIISTAYPGDGANGSWRVGTAENGKMSSLHPSEDIR
ncbi:hypothetical protein ANCCAN_16634 [Ancylostoma caninum]|uniref:RRM domain-containing protein n=1 Tax=Ancylostoma caninum TaxID=29170 RepID=A0A368G196_ANCCA|nr:hypothetical protein ANCCAN_16634 [Ancylostoma caninum]